MSFTTNQIGDGKARPSVGRCQDRAGEPPSMGTRLGLEQEGDLRAIYQETLIPVLLPVLLPI
jgi:hypothetical protein